MKTLHHLDVSVAWARLIKRYIDVSVTLHHRYRYRYHYYSRESEFIRRPCPSRPAPYRTVPYPTVFREGLFSSTAQRTVLFWPFYVIFYLKARTLPRFKCLRFTVLTLIFRLSANRTVPTHEPFFVILLLKTIIWWNLIEKREPYRDEFLCEK
jgi:hypothetical protein